MSDESGDRNIADNACALVATPAEGGQLQISLILPEGTSPNTPAPAHVNILFEALQHITGTPDPEFSNG